MSLSEAHPRGAHGRFATGGTIERPRGIGFVGESAPYPAVQAPSWWRHPVRWWYRRKARRRIAAVRARQRTYSGTFKVAPDQVYSRLVYQWLVRECVHVQARRAPWSTRAVAKAATWAIVLRMVRGG